MAVAVSLTVGVAKESRTLVIELESRFMKNITVTGLDYRDVSGIAI